VRVGDRVLVADASGVISFSQVDNGFRFWHSYCTVAELTCQLSIVNICDNDNVNANETRVGIVAMYRK
jgi:hypothetical protein